MPKEATDNFISETIEPKGNFDPRSFRTVERPGGVLLTIGCPKGHYDPKTKTCKVGTRAQRKLTPKKAGNPGKRDNTLLYVGAALVMVGGVALAFMPKKVKAEDTDTGIEPEPTPEPEPDPYNPDPEPDDPAPPDPDPDDGLDPEPEPIPELPKFSLDFTNPGLDEIKQGGAIDYRINLTNLGDHLQSYRLNLVISSGGQVINISEVASGTIAAHSLKVASVEYSTAALTVGGWYDVRAEVWSGDGLSLIDTALGTTFKVLSPGNVTLEIVRVGFTVGVVPEVKRADLLSFQPKIFTNRSRMIRIESVMPVPGVDSEVNHGEFWVTSSYSWSQFLQHRVPSSASDGTNTIIVRAIDPLSDELLSETIGTYKVVG